MVNNKSITIIVWNSILTSFGGVETQIYYISKALAARGWYVQILSPRRPIINKAYQSDKIEYLFYKVYNSHWLTIFHCLYILIKNRRTKFVLSRGNFEHIVPAFLLKLVSRVKFVWWICLNVEVEEKYKHDFTKNGVSRIRRYYREINNKLLDWLCNTSRIHADYIVTQSFYQLNLACKAGYKNVYMLRNMHVLPEQKVAKEKLILWSGPLVLHKQPEQFLEIVKRMIGSDFRFIMIGRFSENFPEYKTMLNNSMGSGFVHYQAVGLNEMLSLFSKAMIYINTSYFEGFPNNFIQAWLSKTVVFSLGLDPDQLIAQKHIGKTFSSTEEIIAALNHFNYNSSEYKSMVTRAYDMAIEEFNVEKQISKLEKILLDDANGEFQ